MQSITLSASAIKTYLECSEKYRINYIERLTEVDGSSFELNYGKAFHGLVEGDRSELAAFGPLWQSVVEEHYTAYTNYHHESKLEYIAHEVPFEFELVPGLKCHGFLDGIARHTETGEHVIVETKTTSSDISIGADYWKYREQDLQVGLYLLAAQHDPNLQGYSIDTVVYDVARRPGVRRKRSESGPAYIQRVCDWYANNAETAFRRVGMTRSDTELHDLGYDISVVAEMIRRKGFARDRSSCYKYRRECGFYQSCFGSAPLKPGPLYKVRKSRRKA